MNPPTKPAKSPASETPKLRLPKHRSTETLKHRPTETLIASARRHHAAAEKSLRASCSHALLAGLALLKLHAESAAQGARNDYGGTGGFESALAATGIPQRTAYRWINAAGAGLIRAGLLTAEADPGADLPKHGSKDWKAWEAALNKAAQGISLNRLLLGSQQPATEDDRYDQLLTAAEESRPRAIELLDALAAGRYTLTQAIRALGSQEAYDALRANADGEKVRRDPIYLDYDVVKKTPAGLLPRAITTIRHGFHGWDTYDERARAALTTQWEDLLAEAPAELLTKLRKPRA